MFTWYKNLPTDEQRYCDHWAIMRGETIAYTAQFAGIAFYAVMLLLAPFIGNVYNQTVLYVVYGTFLVTSSVSTWAVNQIGRYKRANYYFYSLACPAAIGYFIYIGRDLPETMLLDEMVIAPAAFLVMSTFLLLSNPYFSPAACVVTPFVHYLIGVAAIAGTSFGPRWMVILALSTSLSALWHFIESRRSMKLALAAYRDQKKIAEAQRREAEQKARESELQMKTMVLTSQMLAHDLRNPLTLFKSIIQLLQGADSTSVHLLLKKSETQLESAVESMTSMINDIVDASATPRLTNGPVSLHTIWMEALRQVVCHFPQKSVRLKYNIDHRDLLLGDQQKLIRIFANLIKNALEAMPDQESITLTTSGSDDAMITVAVTNTGSYVEASDIDSLFEAFHSKNRKKGVGLGLTIVKKFVESHGGTIRCTSSKTAGTTFTFELPVKHEYPDAFLSQIWPESTSDVLFEIMRGNRDSSDEKDRETIADLTAVRNGRPLRILIIDDESIYANLLKSYVEPLTKARTINVLWAGSPDDALSLAGHISFDAIICDIDLQHPSRDGYDVVRELRAANNTTYICIHSNRLMPEDTSRSLSAGADVFFPKPMARMQFYRIINAASRKRDAA